MNNGSSIPLHIQNPALVKGKGQQVNPSWESFGPHQRHQTNHSVQKYEDRPNTHAMSIIRRNPDGTLDYAWAKNMVIDAVHGLSQPHANRDIHDALLTVIFPTKIQRMNPSQAQIVTQFSDSEKDIVRQMVEAHFKAEENWNAGRGGGSVPGRSQTRNG